MSPLFIGTGIAALALNVIVSLLVLFSSSYLPSQKRIQLVLIWLLPFLGALAAFAVIREDQRKPKRMEHQCFDPPANPPGI